jgi:hypothetical protein
MHGRRVFIFSLAPPGQKHLSVYGFQIPVNPKATAMPRHHLPGFPAMIYFSQSFDIDFTFFSHTTW